MSVYYRLVLNSVSRSNHHRLAVMALQHLNDEHSARWRDLFLHHQESYLTGAKAPDAKFKDFKNHVLHVGDNFWGGAPASAREWYTRTVRALSNKDWKHAAYCAGVMSHYVCDPVQPFHTGQTETENTIHRAVEWSFFKTFPEMHLILEQDLGYPDVPMLEGDEWLEDMVRAGATVSNKHYDTVIDHFNFEVGRKHPEKGCDQELKDTVAGLLGYATILMSRVLDRAFAEAGVVPPKVNLLIDTLLAAGNVPVRKILKAIEQERERDMVDAQYKEFKETGKVRETLSDDDKAVRAMHAEEVLKVPLSTLDSEWPRETGTAFGKGAPARKTRKWKKRHSARRDEARDAVDTTPVEIAAAEAAPVKPKRKSSKRKSKVKDVAVEAAPVVAAVDTLVDETPDVAVSEPVVKPKSVSKKKRRAALAEDMASDASVPTVAEKTAEVSSYVDEPAGEAANEYDSLSELGQFEEAADPTLDSSFEEAVTSSDEADVALAEEYDLPETEVSADAEYEAEQSAIISGESTQSTREQRRKRIRLRREDDVVDAPSIGPKTANRLHVIGVKTVSDLLELAPQDAAKQIKASHINAQVIRDWQSQALLACSVPGISGTVAQMLVGAGVYTPEDVVDADAEFLHDAIIEFCETKEGERLLRGSEPPEIDAVEEWIEETRWAIENRDAA